MLLDILDSAIDRLEDHGFRPMAAAIVVVSVLGIIVYALAEATVTKVRRNK